MSSSAISVSGLTKRYRIATSSGRSGSFGAVGEAVSRMRGVVRHETLVALDDISLDIDAGEVVGLVGRNGAGKSTFLKILSRIVEPDDGEIRLRGRVGSLLEVGTGFHPELSGRENIYLNGAIIGMRRAAIARAFDSIVEFAGTERFLDTPVKRYSSGMYVRLAFAVAAHLETEILLVDEVLAVGDAAFQAKCLAKIGDVSSAEGRTVLFVSHNTTAVEALCSRALYLSSGQLVNDGVARDVVSRYHVDLFGSASSGLPGFFELADRENPFDQSRPVVISRVRLEDALGIPTAGIQAGEELNLFIDLDNASAIHTLVVGVTINDYGGRVVTTFSTRMASSEERPLLMHDSGTIRIRVPELALAPGDYSVSVGVKDDMHDRKVDAVSSVGPFSVAPSNFFGTGYTPSIRDGVTLVRHEWSTSSRGST